jgi:SAM-dependent methyltransferase
MIPVSGNVEYLRVVDGSIELAGWCIGHHPSWIRGFEVEVAGRPAAVVESRLRMDSPDLVSAYPESSAASASRFAMRVSAPWVTDGALVRIRPIVSTGEGGVLALTSVVNPKLEMPPSAGVHIIGGDYHRTAMEYLGYFTDLVGLRETARVLDVGCGFGRMAYALTHYLRAGGSYLGFDVMADAIQFCKRAHASRAGAFEFVHLDAKNGMYNTGGALDDARIEFPARDVDFVIMTSVITHLLVDATRNYFRQTARSLKRGGCALITSFVVDECAAELVRRGRASAAMRRSDEHRCWLGNENLLERVVGFDEADLLRWIDEAGFDVRMSIPGRWSGRTPALSYQDIFILVKR